MRTPAVLSIASLLVVTGCDPSQVQTCEANLKDSLKSPASYKRVDVETIQITPQIHNPPYDEVTIKYDAANSYNALLRDDHTCFFKPSTTETIENPFKAEVDKSVAEITANADAALEAADNAVEKAHRAVAASKAAVELDPLDACLENATTSDDYAKCTGGENIDD